MIATMKSTEKAEKNQEPSSPVHARGHWSAHSRAPGAVGLIDVQQSAGNLAIQRALQSGAIQAKLSISQLGDPSEEEADRVAERVVSSASVPAVQQKCAACAPGAPCPKCEEETIQRKASSGHSPEASAGISSQIASLRGG